MHPAYSVILFTTASGAGYGLLTWLAVWLAAGSVGHDKALGFVGMALALGLITVGLLSSTFHLGRPERAWRAFSQWRTSWLSREGVMSLATYVPAVLLAALWVFWRAEPMWLTKILAALTVVFALATVWCTGMIYQSLPTIPHWHQPVVAPMYIALSLASGAVLWSLLLLIFAHPAAMALTLTIVLLMIALATKLLYWYTRPRNLPGLTAGEATGLGKFGRVRMTEQPHSRDNFVMREMGYHVARKHAATLKTWAMILGFIAPALLLALSLWMGNALAVVFAFAAALSAAFGLVTERWLFFAEAKHVSMLFYGDDAV